MKDYFMESRNDLRVTATFNNVIDAIDYISDNDVDVISCRYDINSKIPNSFLDNFNPEKYDFKGKYDKENDIIYLDSVEDFPNIMTLGHPTMIWTKIFRKSLILHSVLGVRYRQRRYRMKRESGESPELYP